MTDREAMQQAQLEKLDGTLWMLNQELTRKQVEIDALQKLMWQALEALERSVGTCFHERAHHEVMSRPDHFVNQAINALRQALGDK